MATDEVRGGFRTVEEGARIAVRIATDEHVPTGAFLNDDGHMVW